MIEQDNLTDKQKDYAIFLPALSSFYSTYIGAERYPDKVKSIIGDRLPKGIPNMEAMNWLNKQEGLFPYKWSLYSAGHANMDLDTFVPKEDMVRNRSADTLMVADSGGFQIAKGVWPGAWADTKDKAAQKKREAVIKWQSGIANYGMTLDIPTWTYLDPKASEACGIKSYQDAVDATLFNNEFFMEARGSDLKILNVLQGSNHTEADQWYNTMKKFCSDQYDRPFEGWGMGGQNMCDLHLILRRLVTIIHDGLLEKGQHDWMHFLGTSKLEWALLLTDIQRSVRRHHNSNFTVSFDCASPFLATANGQVYTRLRADDRGKKWSYLMEATADRLKYAYGADKFSDVVVRDGIHERFDDSPISERCTIGDICKYGVGDKNKIGTPKILAGDIDRDKNGNPILDDNGNQIIRERDSTSWDSFSYALLMGHNVWQHIYAVQESNRLYDQGIMPAMLVNDTFTNVTIRDVIDEVFAQKDYHKSMNILDKHSKLLDSVIGGSRGTTGKKIMNSKSQFNALFD
tara:strand:+ start:57 stop:1604 length:1548 start_codon:yes stop_codon:yes gene_type:complete